MKNKLHFFSHLANCYYSRKCFTQSCRQNNNTLRVPLHCLSCYNRDGFAYCTVQTDTLLTHIKLFTARQTDTFLTHTSSCLLRGTGRYLTDTHIKLFTARYGPISCWHTHIKLFTARYGPILYRHTHQAVYCAVRTDILLTHTHQAVYHSAFSQPCIPIERSRVTALRSVTIRDRKNAEMEVRFRQFLTFPTRWKWLVSFRPSPLHPSVSVCTYFPLPYVLKLHFFGRQLCSTVTVFIELSAVSMYCNTEGTRGFLRAPG